VRVEWFFERLVDVAWRSKLNAVAVMRASNANQNDVREVDVLPQF